MSDLLLPISFALAAWWLGTGVVLYLNQLPRNSYRWSMLGASVVLAGCLVGLVVGRTDTTASGALLAFSEGLLVWAWLEMSYFMGFITGPSKRPCPPQATDWQRFKLALNASLHHELLVVAFGVSLLALSWDAPNPVGAWTFLVLWLMRWSAKLNIFLGVPNLNEAWLPEDLRFLTTFIKRRALNLLFPVSVTVSTVVATSMFQQAISGGGFEQTAYALVATLLTLAILEHWFLVLPVKDSALWNWALDAAGKISTNRGQTDPRPNDEHPPSPESAKNHALSSKKDHSGSRLCPPQTPEKPPFFVRVALQNSCRRE